MDNKTRISNLSEAKFQVILGVHKATYNVMLAILNRAYEEMRKRGGRKRQLSVLNMLQSGEEDRFLLKKALRSWLVAPIELRCIKAYATAYDVPAFE